MNDTPLSENIGNKSRFHWKKWVRSFLGWQIPEWSVPLSLLVVCILSYLLLIRHLGYYWDDFPFIWISQKLGKAGLIRYFFTNRPVWGLTYQVSAPLLGYQPWHWHVYALMWRWIAAVLLWVSLRMVWPKHPQPALWVSLLFVVYPGSQEQFVSVVYSHFFLVLSAFLGSIACSLLAFRRPRWYIPLTVAGLLLSAVNLLMLEYFFLLELIRPVLLWISSTRNESSRKTNLRRVGLHWLPYLILFIGAIVWRTIFYAHQTTHYSISLLDNLGQAPFSTVISLLLTIARDLWLSTFGAWGQVFSLPDPGETGKLTMIVYTVIVMATLLGGLFYLLHQKSPQHDNKQGKFPWHSAPWAGSVLSVGLIALLVAGPAFWLTGLKVSLHFPHSRFTLAFLLGASLFVAGLVGLLPVPNKVRPVLLAVCLSLGVGHQFINANEFRRDLDITQAFFWQMAWRIPGIEPGTALVINELPIYSTDNSLTAMVNWIYSPDNSSAVMDYYLYYPGMRLGTSLPLLESGDPIEQDYLAATFYGSTKQVMSLYFSPPGCLRVLDPEIEPYNPMLPEVMRYAAEYTTQEPILYPKTGSAVPQEDIFGQELPHEWCYYFEKADLARQIGDWQSVAALGDIAFSLDNYPNDHMERTPFIEGYAHEGQWDRAVELTRQFYIVAEQMQPVLCRLWDRILRETADAPENAQAQQEIEGLLSCSTE